MATWERAGDRYSEVSQPSAGSGVLLRDYQPTEPVQDTEVAEDALISFNEDVSQVSKPFENEPNFHPGGAMVKHTASLRPLRPPPPPPSKKRSVSDNPIVDLDTKLVNLDMNPTPSTGSSNLTPMHAVYVVPGIELAKEETDTVRNSKSASLFYAASSPDSNVKPAIRTSRSSSTFYIGSSPKASSVPVTSQPAAMNSKGSSFYDILPTESNELSAEKLLGGREQIMQICMAKRQEEYTVRQPFNVFAGTWNVNGQTPPDDVKDWLSSGKLSTQPPDIYFIAFQELDLSKEAYVFSVSLREDEWITVVSRSLPSANIKYFLLKSIRLIGMMLLVYVKTIHVLSIKDVSCHQVGTGILGRMGNKGGVGVHLSLHNSTICVVNSHLAAHMEQCKRRNEDFRDICSRLQFPVSGQAPMSVYQHDIVFWLGDVNYRIQDIDSEKVKKLINENGFERLRKYDQLISEKAAGNVFQNFREGEINFRPTYKYNPGTDNWDTSDKCRTPAWCDRILWWEYALNQSHEKNVKPQSSVDLLKYQQHTALKISDHKPVSALFDIKVKVIDEGRYKKVFEDENRGLDKLENEYLPSMKLDIQHIDFGDVKFQQPKSQTVEIDNNGMVPCRFEFISRPGEPNFCRKWLTITRPQGCLFPGDKFILEFEVYVNRVTAPLLNSGEEKLEDILILHLDGGKDFFITVNGRYLPSCFGTSIEALCRLPRPIRFASPEEIRGLSNIQPIRASDFETSSALAIPKELWTLVDHLYTYAKKQEELFQQPGLHSEVENIRDCLDAKVDTGRKRAMLPGSNHSVAEALLILLEAFPEPVIPFYLYERCLEVCEIFHTCKQVLQRMSPHHRNVFKYLTAFLRELLQFGDENGLDLELVSSIFSGLMLRPPPGLRKNRIESKLDRDRASRFLTHFLRNSYDE